MRSHRLLGKVLMAIAIMALLAVACGGSSTEQIREAAVAVATETTPIEPAEDTAAEEPAAAAATAAPQATDAPAPEPTAPPTAAPVVEAAPINLISQGFGQEGQSAAYAFVVENPNAAIGFEDVAYQIAAKDDQGTIIATDSGYITALFPNQSAALAGTLFIDEGNTIATLEVQLSSGEQVATEPIDSFVVEGIQYFQGDFTNSVTGILTSAFARPIDDVRVSAITYDESGAINGGGFTFVNFIPADDRVGVDVSVTSSGPVARVELYPTFSFLSLLGMAGDAPADAQPLELVNYGVGQDEFGASYGFLVRNPNSAYAVESGKYVVTAFDDTGRVIATDSGYMESLAPGQEFGIGGSLFPLIDVPIAQIEVQVLDGSFVESEPVAGFTAENVAYVPGDFMSEVTGMILNPFTSEITNLRVNALAFDEAGQIIGGGFTFLDFIPAQGSSPVSVSITSAAAPATVQLYTSVSSLSDFSE